MANRYLPAEERFWRRVDRRGEDACWLWEGPKIEGYGCMSVEGRTVRAHRFSWVLAGIELVPGLELDHLCRHRSCVNPRHLEQVTTRENILRGDGAPARNARVTHCPYGHPYSGRNLAYRRNGMRRCRACSAAANRTRRAFLAQPDAPEATP